MVSTPVSSGHASPDIETGLPAAGDASPPERGARTADVPWFLDGREVVHTLGKRRWLVAIPLAAVLALALAALLLVPARFTASTELLIDPHGLQVVKDDLNPPAQTSDASLLLVDSQMLVLSSDDVLRQVVDKYALDHDPDFVAQTSLLSRLSSIVAKQLGTAGPPVDAKLAALRTLRDRLAVQRLERSFVLRVAVTTDDREKSARLAQGIAEIYLSVEAQSRADISSRASTAISSRLGELQTAVRDAEERAQAFRTANNLVGTRVQLVSEQQLGQIGEQLGTARAQAAEQLARLNQIDAVLKAGGSLAALPEVLQSTTIGQLRTQLAQAERARSDAATRLGSRHPSMIAAEDQVRTARGQLDAEIRRIAISVRTAYKAAEANVAALSQTLDNGKTEAVGVGDAMVRLRELERQVEARRSVYESFLVRARELQAQQQLDTSASRIISPATPPAKREGLPASAILAAALAAGLGLGTGAALLTEQVSGRVRTARRLGQGTGLKVLGALPPAPVAKPGESNGLLAGDAYEMAIARLRSQLGRMMPEAGAKTLLVTAADGASDKARVALKLAALAAADEERVLLVDADPDGNMAHDFHISVAPLPTRVQNGRSVLPEGRVLHMPNLRFLSVSRQATRSDPRLVASMIFRRIDDFDLIVVHAGVLGSDLFTDRIANDPHLMTVLVAVNASASRLPSVEKAVQTLDPDRRLACILTDASGLDA